MSFGLGMAIVTGCFVLGFICWVVYLVADYTERVNYNKWMKYRRRVKDRQALMAEKELKNTIWEATEFAINNIKREMW